MKNIILIGFMGAGKTSVGKALAERLHWKWIDTDAEIERRAGKRIPNIFHNYGEEGFRKMETEVLHHLLQSSGQVISTGGGIVLRKENRDVMVRHGKVVYLKADLPELISRLRGSDRPLLQGDMEGKIKELWTARKGFYDFASVTVETTNRSIDDIVEEILQRLINVQKSFPFTGKDPQGKDLV
ncbi:Shikimate kinase [[Clostridium] ultunense Esp]|nr:Shikimate kinase [[Clostridium] ultunense Esp]